MSGSFTLVGALFHHDKVTPHVETPIVLEAGLYPDMGDHVTYLEGAAVLTGADGEFSIELLTETDLVYRIRSAALPALFDPIIFSAPADGTTVHFDELTDYVPTAVTPSVLAAALAASASATASAAAAAASAGSVAREVSGGLAGLDAAGFPIRSLPFWRATTAVSSGQILLAPDGSTIASNSARTTRASFDATEQTFWTVVEAKTATLVKVALDNAYPARVTPTKDAPAFGLFFPEAHGTVGAGTDSAAIQGAIDACRAQGGGKVWLSARAAGYTIDAAISHPSRVRVEGLSASGDVVIKAANGLNRSMWRVGATDGTDPNWHWGELSHIFLDGNKANQTRPAAVAISAAATVGYVATITTGAAHNLLVGDFTEISGMTPAAYNGRWRVESVIDATHFTIQHLTNSAGAGSAFGTSRILLNGINVGKGGEASSVNHVYVTGCLNSGIAQGTTGTPMTYRNVSTFSNGDYGYDLWCDRPIVLDSPSGDLNGLGLIRAAGTASAGGTGTDSSLLILNPKAEHHTVPVVTLDDYDGPVTVLGGSIDMETTNTGPVFRRTAASSNSSLFVIGCRINPRASGTVIFQDQTAAARNVTTTSASAETWTFDIARQPRGLHRFTQFRNDLTDAATTVPNLQNGTICKWVIGGTPRTLQVPANRPVGSPNAERLVLDIKNNTAGAIAITWDALFIMPAFTPPAAGKRKTIEFWWDGSNYVQVGNPSPDM